MSEVTLALKIIKEYCGEQSSDSCDECPLYPVCYENVSPMVIDIPESTLEPTERQRIEWLRMLPDGKMLDAVIFVFVYDGRIDYNDGPIDWWHEVVSLAQFRKDVGLG